VRKEAKSYGTGRLAEGAELAGRQVLIIEDVVASAGQIAISAERLRELGASIGHALCVIDRQEGGAAALADVQILLRALITREVLETA
jgi:orotate phosphoribosyltransferase